MKKILIIAVFALALVNVVSAQNKHRVPEDYAKAVKGTWGLGFQTTVLHRSDIKWQNGLYAKYFVADKWALRTNLRFGVSYAKGIDPDYITDEDVDTYYGYSSNSSNARKEVIRKSNVMITLGVEHRHKLSNRFFGYYGADFGIGGYGALHKYYNTSGGTVTDKVKTNRCCDVAFQPFIGLEFFVGPQISLGMEAGYDVLFKFYGKRIDASDLDKTHPQIDKDIPYTSLAANVDFGNCVFGTAKISFYF